MKKTYKYINKMGDTFEIQNGQKVRVLDRNECIIQWCEVSRGCVRLPTMYGNDEFARMDMVNYRLNELRAYGYDIDEVSD